MYNVNFSKFFLGWPFFNMNNFWLKKYEKSVTEFRKGKTMERRFPKVFHFLITIRNVLRFVILFLPIKTSFFKFLQLPKL